MTEYLGDGSPGNRRFGSLLLLITLISLRRAAADPAPILDPNHSRFPRSSLVDFSYLLDAPAGKHGFLSTRRDGHFYFSDGTRGRFWGINIASRSVFQSREVIDQVVDVLAKAGFNLVRIHHVDERHGIFDVNYPDTRHLDESRLRILDYWVSQLKARGIYTYLDLLDYRTFKAGDGVEKAEALGRGAKPYVVFNQRLIELQKEYARQLLVDHVNPFTGLSYAKDPSVVMLELFDENGVFMKRGLWQNLVEPYAAEFSALWNQWLKDQYGSTEKLAQTWTNAAGQCALFPLESLERGSIELPIMELGSAPRGGDSYAHSLKSPARKNDAARFAYDLQRRYFREMKSYLRSLGVVIPLTAVTRSDEMPDLKSVGDELDFVGNNFYWDHPFWGSGREWQFPSYFMNRNPLAETGDSAFGPGVMISKIKGVPLVVREWSYCWPNRYRAAGTLEAAAYGCLQDLDALILFSMGIHEDANLINFFDVHLDPARWGMVGFAARLFLQQDVSPSDYTVSVAYSPVDTFRYFDYSTPLHQLGFVSRIQNEFVDDSSKDASPGSPETTLTIASARSSAGKFLGRQQLLRANFTTADLYDHDRRAIPEFLEAYGFSSDQGNGVWRTAPAGGPVSFLFDGVFLTSGPIPLETRYPFSVEALSSRGFKPIGVSSGAPQAFGFHDPLRRNFVFNTLSDLQTVKVALDALGFMRGRSISRRMAERKEFVSDHGQVIRNSDTGRLLLDTPRLKALAGDLKTSGQSRIGGVSLKLSSEVGALAVCSLDAQPIEKSGRINVKFVSNAANTGQSADYQSEARRYLFQRSGGGPTVTFGSVSRHPTRVDLGKGRIIEVYQENGVWELVMEYRKVFFYSDTPGVILRLPGLPASTKVTAYWYDGTREDCLYGDSVVYPAGAALVCIEGGQ